jgi:hypothetical protein
VNENVRFDSVEGEKDENVNRKKENQKREKG